jgi:hypothetical protein
MIHFIQFYRIEQDDPVLKGSTTRIIYYSGEFSYRFPKERVSLCAKPIIDSTLTQKHAFG